MARKKSDPAHEATDKEIAKIEREIAKEYRQAHKEVTEKLNDYLARFAVKDEIWRKRVENGEIPEKEYIDWRRGQMLIGKRWEGMCETLAQDYANAAKIAQSITKGYAPEVYAINHNYATFDIEKKTGLDTSYTLYSRETIERMYRENPKIYHDYGKAVGKDIKEGKQVAWDKKRVRSVLTQAVLQGESIPKVVKRLEIVTGGDHNAAIRNARTMMTGVQNAGRIDAMNRAQDKGIPVRKQWLATIDGRTRHWHRELDGAVEDLDKPFENSIGKIMFPADPDADGANVYNCRCTLLSAIKGFELDVTDPSIRPMPKLKDMTYEEWKTAKAPKGDVASQATKIAQSDAKLKAITETEALQDAVNGTQSMKDLVRYATVGKVEYRTVNPLPKNLTEDEIIKRLAGGDQTTGSCVSLACAFAGNMGGYDVLDFRGGESCKMFALNVNNRKLRTLDGVVSKSIEDYSSIKGATQLITEMEDSKLYILITGKHASVVRKIDGKAQYLELQSAYSSGWHDFTSDTLKRRFGCTKTRTSYGQKFKQNSFTIEIDSLYNNKEFADILGYINTEKSKQKKGVLGSVK